MKKGNKLLKTLIKIIAVALTAVVLYFAVGFFGNPVSALLCKNSAKKYVAENYPGYTVEKTGYNFKNSNYYAYIDMENKLDAGFYINMDWLGNVIYDTYSFYIESKSNTHTRMKIEYDKLVEDAIAGTEFNVTLAGGDILYSGDYEPTFGLLENPDKVFMPEGEVIPEKIFDYTDLGAKYGKVTVWVEEEDVSYSNAANIMLDIKDRLDKAGVKTYYVDLYLRQPKTEDGYVDIEGIQFKGFRYADIYPDGLEERIETAHKTAMDFYARIDAENQK